MYSTKYKIEILDESKSDSKSSDFAIYPFDNKKVYIECKALEDFEIRNDIARQQIIDAIQKYCVRMKQSNIILIKTGEDFIRQNTHLIIKEIKQHIRNNHYGVFPLERFNIIVEIQKFTEWNNLLNGYIDIRHPLDCQFNVYWQTTTFGSNQFRLVGIKPTPILNYENRIEREIKIAKNQIPKNELGIIHIQLPIHQSLIFEKYMNKNYSKIKNILENKTTRVNAVVISNPIYNLREFNPKIQNNQYYVIPNMKSETSFDFNFYYPFANIIVNNIPDIIPKEQDSKIELKNIIYTPYIEWEKIPAGTIQLNLISSSARTQFKIWKSYDNTITFDVIINGERICVKSVEIKFIKNEKNCIDITIEKRIAHIFINKNEIQVFPVDK